MNRYVRKSLKFLLWFIAGIIMLVILIAISLNIPAVQNFVKNKAINYLKNKTHTEVSLESIKIALPKDVVLNKFYIEDKKGDTLLYASRLAVDISLFKLLKSQIEINNIELENIRANVKRIAPDTAFNFSFLVDAFMSEQKKPQDKVEKDSSATLKFSIDKFSFKDIGINYRDDVAGNDVKLYLGEFKSKIKDFDLANQHYVIKNLELNNTSLKYLQQKPLTTLAAHLENSIDKGKDKAGKLPLVEIEDFNFHKVKISFDDRLSDTRADLNINELVLKTLFADLTNSKFTADEANLRNSQVLFAMRPVAHAKNPAKSANTTAAASMDLLLKKINLENNSIRFDNLAMRPAPKGMDFNHLKINQLGLAAENLAFNKQGISVLVKSAGFKEQSGFQLNKLQGNASYNDQMIQLRDFVLQTPNTAIESSAALNFSSMDDLTKNPEKVKVALSFKNTTIGLKDAGYFSDVVPLSYRNLKIKVNASLNGYLNDLNIPQLQISGLRSTSINISGKVKGLPDAKKAFLDLNIKQFKTTKSDLLAIIPPKSIPQNITLPNAVAVNGKFKGSLTNFNTNLIINTDMGSAAVIANMSGPKGREKYAANVRLNNFNVGRMINQQPKLGRVTVAAAVNGTGLDPKKGSARFNAKVLSAFYNNYTYRNVNLGGTFAGQKLNVKGNSTDQNVSFNLVASADLNGKYPKIKTDLELKQVDLQALNFSSTEFKLAGMIKADIRTADVDYLNGDVFATGLQVVKEGRRINLDTIELHAASSADSNLVVLRSEFASLRLEGKYQLSKIGNAVVNQVNKYYQFGTVTTIPDQRIRFALNVSNPKILKDFVPELTTFSPSRLSGLIDTRQDSLILNGWFPQIVYGDFKVDSTRLTVNNTNNRLNYLLNVRSLQGSSVQLFNTEISGNAANNQLGLNVFLRDRQRKDRYVIVGTFNSLNKDYRFSLDPNKLLLNYQQWMVAPDNLIQFGKSGILANNFNLTRESQVLRINSEGSRPNAPLNVELRNFRIETLTSFAEADSTLVGGAINGTVKVNDIASNPKFEANLTVNQLRYKKDMLGDLRLTVNNNTANAFEVNAAVTGVHEVRVNGFYYTAPQSALDLTLNIDKLDLKALESVSGGQIRQGTGTITGQFTAKGALTAPKVLGELRFNQAGFNIKYVNSYFRVPDERISFTSEGIGFSSFTLIDSLNKKAVIDGMVYTTDFKNIRFGLDIKTDNFRALNSTAKDNELIYGTVFLSTNLRIRGDMNQPDVNGSVNINEGTKFFFALPADDPSVIEQSGIVQFIDEDAPPFNGQRALNVDSLTRSPMKGMNLSVNVEIDKAAELTVVVDPANGDALRVKGQGSLNATIDPSGKVSLTGRYELTDGAYNLSVGGLSRKEFKIQPGSTIIWTGEPTSADINITAIYQVNTAAIDLVADQIESMDASVRNTYKQKLPFRVYLMLTGELLKPTIAFRLDLPENERGGTVGYTAYAKLQQVNSNESELNKQVFALLALNRFISENPFESLAGGTSTSSLARQSVSKLLTEQLNNLASDLITGIDINLGVNSVEDYSSGSLENRTDLEVGLSKRLLNDRLTISVGSTFGIEGPRPANQSSSNIAGNINVEYLLSADGRYRLRFYRRNETEAVVEGQIIETGVGFALVVDYNKFREIFQKRNKRKGKINKELDAVETVNDKKKP